MNNEILSYKKLAQYRNEFIEAQKELKEKNLFFCPKCYTMTKLDEKSMGLEECKKCTKKNKTQKMREYRARKKAERKAL